MIPARFVLLPQLPRNTNDKIDRRALPPPGRTRPALDTPFAAPHTDLETRIAAIWRKLLNLDQVGIHDNFFALGGDSLLAMNLVLEIEKLTDRQISADYFRNPTIAGLAALASNRALPAETGSIKNENTPIPPRPTPVPSPWRHRLNRLRARQVTPGLALRWIIREVSLRLPFFYAVRWLAW